MPVALDAPSRAGRSPDALCFLNPLSITVSTGQMSTISFRQITGVVVLNGAAYQVGLTGCLSYPARLDTITYQVGFANFAFQLSVKFSLGY
jgi:hypothetical protein